MQHNNYVIISLIESDVCMICLLEINEEKYGGRVECPFEDCSHIFHKDHLEEWLSDHTFCPCIKKRKVEKL